MDLPSLNYNTKLFNSELAMMQTEQQVRESYRDALVGVRTCGLNLGYGIRREPLRDYSHLKTRPSVRPVVLGQWLIEHGSLVDTVLANYDSLSPGTAKQLMCGTSSGKTTELPVCIANTRGTSVLVLSPMLNITAHVLGYMSGVVAKKHGLSSGVHILTEQVIQKPISDSTVYLCALGEFLASLSKVPSLTQRLSISTIIVDESHFTRPEYEMFKYLVAMNFFPNVIVLYASATAASDISMESTGRRTVSYFPVKSIPEEPENTDASLPFHYSRVTNHTMVFAWSDESVEKWVNYYQNHDIPAIGIGHALRSSHDSVIIDFFKNNATGVLVTTSLHETSFTYDVDMVIDFGRTTEINTDFNTGVTSMVVRNATVSEQVQRAGRVGRFKKGAAYIAKVENTVPRDADDPNICQYIYLWSRVFGININHPPISDFSRIFGSVSPEVVAMMLTSSLPPMALRPYCSMDGMYPAFASAYKVFTPVHSCVVKSRAVECPGIKDWEERSAHHVSLDGGVAIYKSRFAMTGALKLFQYHLWARSQDIDDIATVRSFALSDSATVRSKHVSFASARSYKIPDRTSIVSTDEYDDTASAWSDTDTTEESEVEVPKSKIPSVAPPVYSSNAPALPRQLPPKIPVTDRVKTHPVREWSEQVVSSSSSSSSGGSGIDPDMPMKQVDPEKHARDFLYPMNFELRKKYANMYAVNDRDTERVKLCVHGKTDFSKLSSDSSTLREKQTAYFLSFLRVHRSLLVKLMQLRAKPESRGFFHNSSKSDKIAIITDKIRSVAMLLVMCAKLGFTVGIERKGLHSGWSVSESMGTTQQSEVMDAKMEKAHDIATFAVAMAPPAVAENVSHLRSAALPIISESGELIANGWYFNGLAVTAKHVWELMSEHQKVDWCQSDINKVQCVDDTVAVVTETLGKVVPVRPPVNGEHVGLLAAVAPNKKPKMYGYHQVNCVTSPILIEGVYFPGLSGSLLVSYTDGHVVGIYCGFYMNYQGVLWGRVSPAVLSAG